jgi:hypothetical protein
MRDAENLSTAVRLPPTRCPHCGYTLDAASVLDGPAPKPTPGDLSVCFGCGAALQFDKRLRVTKLTLREIARLHPDERADLERTQRNVREFLATGA